MRRASTYLRALKSHHWPVDFMNVHIYPEINRGVKRWKWMLRTTQVTLRLMRCPVRDLWVTETSYGLLGPAIPETEARQLFNGTPKNLPVYWYSPGRPDLGGMNITLKDIL
jgi:hypothetical protein